MFALLCTLMFNSVSYIDSSSVFPTHLFLNRMGPCYVEPKTTISLSEFSITRNHYNFTLYGELNITRDLENGWRVKATMQKCQDIRNLDTCDFYKSFTLISSGCTDDAGADETELYTALFDTAIPKIGCPITAGTYKISKYPFFSKNNALMVSESKISTSVFGYTFRIDGYDSTDEKIFCADAHLRLIYMREYELTYDKVDDKEGDTIGESEIEEVENMPTQRVEGDSTTDALVKAQDIDDK